MAGLFPDIPGDRFALDQDGSVMKWRNFTASTAWTDVTASFQSVLNVNTAQYLALGSQNNTEYRQVAVAFPEPRDIDGVYLHPGNNQAGFISQNWTWDYSTDTTDGTDGTWSSFSAVFALQTSHDSSNELSKPYYRSDIANVALTGVRGIRVRFNLNTTQNYEMRLFTLHIYGSRTQNSVDRLAFWDPSVDLAADPAHLDFGDNPQGTVQTKQVRVKNLSASLTANTVSVSRQDIAAEFGSGLQLSTDDTTYSSSINLGSLAPGAISSAFYVRRIVGPAETETQRSAQILVNAASWS